MRLARFGTAALVACCAIFVTACGDNDSDTASSGSSESVDVVLITELTGPLGPTGQALESGVKFAIDEANREAGEDGTKINLTVRDNGSDQAKSVSEVTRAARSDADLVIYGVSGASASAMAPIAQKEGLPMVVVSASGSWLETAGDRIFRVTGDQLDYQHLSAEFMKEQGVKSASVVYQNDNPIGQELGKEWPRLLEENGIEMLSSTAVQLTDTDFTALASKIAEEDPDAVWAGLNGQQNTTLLTQLDRDGWTGWYGGWHGMAHGVIPSLKERADKLFYPTSFHASTPRPVGADFAKRYEEENGEEPLLWAGEGADAIAFLTKALESTSEVNRDALTEALTTAMDEPLDGVTGKIVFEDRDATVPGILVLFTKGEASVPLTGE